MSVNVGKDGRRSVQVEVEVPGSPEQVWEAIATGPGISSWFVPTEVEERVGGTITANFGPGMDSKAAVTAWNPPHQFTADSEGMGPGSPPMATEWTVEAKSGGTCVVRVVHSWFASTDEWDGQFGSVEHGWKGFFNILRLKLQHFLGQPAAAFDVTTMAPGDAWANLATPLGLNDATLGQEIGAQKDAPALAGRVEVATGDEGGEHHLMLLTREPSPGVCHLFAMPMGGNVYVSARFFLFGHEAEATVAKVKPEWTRWFNERFAS